MPEPVRADTVSLFAAGSLLFEMLCGKPPFAGDNVVHVLHAITAEQPPALGGSPAIVAANRVIHRALSKNPEDRYQTAEEFSEDLHRVEAGLPLAPETSEAAMPMKASTNMTAPAATSKAGRQNSNRRPEDRSVIVAPWIRLD